MQLCFWGWGSGRRGARAKLRAGQATVQAHSAFLLHHSLFFPPGPSQLGDETREPAPLDLFLVHLPEAGLGSSLHELPVAVKTKHRKLGSLEQKCSMSQTCRKEVQNRGVGRAMVPLALEEKDSTWPLSALGSPRLWLACGGLTPVFTSSSLFARLSLCPGYPVL